MDLKKHRQKMSKPEFKIVIELDVKVREVLDRVLKFKDGEKFYIKSNGDIGKETENEILGAG